MSSKGNLEFIKGFLKRSKSDRINSSMMIALIDIFIEDRSQSEIAASIGVTPSNMTHIIDTLEGKGLIKKEINKKNRRAFIITITEKGKKYVNEITSMK